ncbi:pyrimidine/purine nucleoside phosphorylase [Acinetobacter stercoris]|uniref:Pyrimidine/purine nucleoside phosphorylase n=1 Tax=Acinetobacter stercoris TaxID=2126983 RepID=A0A2U3N3Q0_9GAMM|nr:MULTISPECIES: pyrimidine/purine nucleoside phosphorylase [Acinetobacter]SPL72244.1 hypothetical protein KPC_3422 [Acinetobacter stercoris]
MTNQFDFVSVTKKSNVHFGGLSISHIIKLEDGTQKTLGVILPSEQPLTFRTHVAERIEIISGECRVKIGQDPEVHIIHAGESFEVPENSQFSVTADEIVDYVCHLEK